LTAEDDEIRAELARARAEARDQHGAGMSARQRSEPTLPELVSAPERSTPPPAPCLPTPPDASAVNTAWRPPSLAGGGILGGLRRAAGWLLRPQLDSRTRFDSEQVRLDNELLTYVSAHFAATHRHFDGLVAAGSVRIDEIDQRHQQSQERIVAHIQELVQRVGLLLDATERSRLSSESDMRRVAPRLEALERRLEALERRRGG